MNEKKKEIMVGGQAVIEGVMMRGPEYLATAIRRKNKEIELKKQKFTSATKKNKFLGLPIVRGFTSLIEMMIIGFKTLTFSAKRAELDWEEEEKEKRKKTEKRKIRIPQENGRILQLCFRLWTGFPAFCVSSVPDRRMDEAGKN